jgi:hypothetical protein
MGKPDPLPPDPDAVENWRKLPQNKPSRQALPPATGGNAFNRALLIGLIVIIIIVVIATLLSGGRMM